jgi:hypothetical protein
MTDRDQRVLRQMEDSTGDGKGQQIVRAEGHAPPPHGVGVFDISGTIFIGRKWSTPHSLNGLRQWKSNVVEEGIARPSRPGWGTRGRRKASMAVLTGQVPGGSATRAAELASSPVAFLSAVWQACSRRDGCRKGDAPRLGDARFAASPKRCGKSAHQPVMM